MLKCGFPKKSSGLERGSWKEGGEDPGRSTDPVSGGRSWSSESCVETNAWDAQGPWPVVPEAGDCKRLHNKSQKDFLPDFLRLAVIFLWGEAVKT